MPAILEKGEKKDIKIDFQAHFSIFVFIVDLQLVIALFLFFKNNCSPPFSNLLVLFLFQFPLAFFQGSIYSLFQNLSSPYSLTFLLLVQFSCQSNPDTSEHFLSRVYQITFNNKMIVYPQKWGEQKGKAGSDNCKPFLSLYPL